jgi:biotin transport system permease protein
MLTLTSPIDTPAHRWPAAAKMAGLAVASLALFAPVPGWGALLPGALILALAGAAAGGWGLFATWARLFRPLWPFAALIVVWHLVIGAPQTGALILVRMAAALGAANLVTMTTRLADMQAVFLWLARPLAPVLPAKTLALAMALVIRFLPVMLAREAQLRDAWAARSPRRASWRLAAPLTLAAIDDADRVAEALRARGGAS